MLRVTAFTKCRYMMRLEYTVKGAQLLKIMAQAPGILAEECMLMIVLAKSDLT